MRYVILRDDDTNALTPVECLERLYRPFLDRGLPVNLAAIPDVATGTTLPDGRPEGFLRFKNGKQEPAIPIGSNQALVRYIKGNPSYHVVQHGFNHDYLEFDRRSRAEISQRLEAGTKLLTEAGFPVPETFVAPYDRLSRNSLAAVAERFKVLSAGWFELSRLPYSWWPGYAAKKVFGTSHWRVGQTVLLTHPGCLLSCFHDYGTMIDVIVDQIGRRRLTVLVTHWWEYYRDVKPDERFIGVLHGTAEYLAQTPDIKVISFRELVGGGISLN